MRVFLPKLIVVSLILLTGCHIPGTMTMEGSGGRNAYNIAIQTSNSEQMLLNLVRLRYFDNPYFIDVSSVTTQFTYRSEASASIPIPGFSTSNPLVLGGDVSWQNQPTLQFTPLEGQAFSQQLLTPIDLQAIQQLVYSGWDVDRVFRLVIQSFDQLTNAPEASGPIVDQIPHYQTFFDATRLLRYFQLRNELRMGVKVSEDEKKLQIAFPYEGEEAKKLARLLKGVYTSNGNYVLSMELGFNVKGQIGVYPRSILSCMYYLSRGVEVPEEDIQCGRAAVTKPENGSVFKWTDVVGSLMTIKSCSHTPKNAYIAIKYRGNWFYIDDADAHSKQTFLLLLQLYNLQAGIPQVAPPVLTLPIGG
ncbi:MAG: hypothetical protein COT84_03680 [Chlamydiae bacterium CG10_big_fil_rev_8_21_14_0_10_35_9]|nr:MAG: hypothetical protein COT84_03680 [Chlamydiae bacterium CG10_big_fil_rev_8_21_14_0_10_35_9]